jgi:hypothetical protein
LVRYAGKTLPGNGVTGGYGEFMAVERRVCRVKPAWFRKRCESQIKKLNEEDGVLTGIDRTVTLIGSDTDLWRISEKCSKI